MASPEAESPTLAIGVDVGGSGIKVGVVDVARGELVSPRLRVVTPLPSGPAKIVPSIVRTVARAAEQASVSVPAGAPGVVFVLTLGTGVGSGMFNDGVLVPNTELGHMEIRGRDAERRSAAAARTRRGLSWKAWAADLDEHLHAIDKLFWPNLIILGGGVSKQSDKFIPRLTVRPRVVPASLRNDAGIVGAAMAAVERGTA